MNWLQSTGVIILIITVTLATGWILVRLCTTHRKYLRELTDREHALSRERYAEFTRYPGDDRP